MSCGSFARESECDVKYFIKKLISMAATLLVVSFLVFLAFAVIPGDPATAKLGTEATPAKVEALREEMGLNRPIPVRYAAWLGGLLQGDMGTSYSYSMPVTKMVSDKIPVTLTLTLMSFAMMVLISIPLGLYTAKHEGGTADHVVLALNQIIMAVPPFFFRNTDYAPVRADPASVYAGRLCFLYKKHSGLFGLPLFPGAGHCPPQGGHGGEAAAQFHCAGNAPGLCENGVQQGKQHQECDV